MVRVSRVRACIGSVGLGYGYRLTIINSLISISVCTVIHSGTFNLCVFWRAGEVALSAFSHIVRCKKISVHKEV